MTENLSYRPVEKTDLEEICKFPCNAEELFFMFPKSHFPLTVTQLELAVETRFDSTVILSDGEVAGFANFYELKPNRYCSIGNVIVNPGFRNCGVGEFLVNTMEHIGVEKYQVSEFRLSCFNTNTKGILLYSKLGYKPYEIEKLMNADNETFALIKFRKEI